MTERALIDGVTSVIVGVADPDRHLALYCGLLGFDVVATDVLPAQTATNLWGAGASGLPVTVLAAAGAATGRIVLVTVDGGPAAGGPAAEEHPHTADLGLAGIDLYTRDIQRTYAELTAEGHPWLTPPATYDVPLGDRQVTVTEGFCLAPDATDLVFVQPANPRGTAAWDADPRRMYTEVTSVVCHVPNADAEIAFWGPEGLGLSIWYDVEFSSPGLEAMTGLSAGARMRLAFLAGPSTARLEITSVRDHAGGVDRRDRQRPGRSLGHSGWVVRTHDLQAATARAAARGGRVLSGPVRTDDALFGAGRAVSLDTPNGIPVTLYEPVR